MNYLFTFGLVVATIWAQAQVKTGVATHFKALGNPYGGCGVPQDKLETQNFVALNVFDPPGQSTDYTMPLSGNDLTHIGEFNNGNNCGRWLKVTILENCNGLNDGQLGQVFCRGTNASWINDSYSGAMLNMIVADACGDPNGWCRDSPYHLDLATDAVNQFEKAGEPVKDLLPLHFNNRKIQWEYVEAPDYTGDIRIFFMQGAQKFWTPVLINHLPNGIHGLEQKVNGKWVKAARYNDMGQAFILPDNTSPLTIRVIDANDQLLQQGREYTFRFPTTCGSSCADPATEVSYTTNAVLTAFDETSEKNQPTISATLDQENHVNIAWQNMPSGQHTLKLIDVTGQERNKCEVSTETSHLLNDLPAGYYRVLFYVNNQLLKTTSVVLTGTY